MVVDANSADFRARMSVVRRWAYLDHAAVAPLPDPAREAIAGWAEQANADGDFPWPTWSARLEEIRRRAAELIAAEPEEIALVPNTTTGISLIAEGLPWEAGDNIVTFANEFPSNLYPWYNLAARGVETRRVPVEGMAPDLQRLADAIDDRTRLVSLSWVGYLSGWRLDLDEVTALVHERGARLLVDAIQGLGVFSLDTRQTPIDFLAADGHKWMLGPEGAGLLFIRREQLDALRPLLVGWNSVENAHAFRHDEFRLRPTAARYEGGSANMPGFYGLGASLDLLHRQGLGPRKSAVAERVLAFHERARQRLVAAGAEVWSPDDPRHRSGILTFQWPGHDPVLVRERCLRHGVVLSCRGGRLRIAGHAYNNDADLDRLLEALNAHE